MRAGYVAGLYTWCRLVGDAAWNQPDKGDPDSGELLRHRAGDDLCPCPRPSCAGGLPGRATASRAVTMIWHVFVHVVGNLAMVWTALVSLGARTWSQPWSATVAAVSLALLLPSAWGVLSFYSSNPDLLRLTSRLRNRAVAIALRRAVHECRLLLLQSEGSPPTAEGADGSEYVDLNRRLEAQWRHGLRAYMVNPFSFLVFIPACIVAAGINAAVGRCIPAWTLLWLLWFLTLLAEELANVAVLNAEVTAAGDRYAAARREVRALLLAAEPGPTENARRKVLAHAGMLDALAAGGQKALFLGFPVGFGTIRTLYVTMATVAFAVWGVLRGLGVVVTMDNVCG
ncbi:hypothetical protein DFJ74DRAFT_532124 [Hyaloraphidium curvatum]|nr:hypothetical protein DFJ74DRAFT_532124 [Hyaloraphidium curvatum]